MSLPWNSAFLRLLSWLLHVSHSTPLPKKRVNLQLSFCLVLTSSSPVSHSSNGKHLPNKHKQNRARNEKYLLFEKVSFVFLLTHKHLVFTITGITTSLYWYATAVYRYITHTDVYVDACVCLYTHTATAQQEAAQQHGLDQRQVCWWVPAQYQAGIWSNTSLISFMPCGKVWKALDARQEPLSYLFSKLPSLVNFTESKTSKIIMTNS